MVVLAEGLSIHNNIYVSTVCVCVCVGGLFYLTKGN